VSVTDGKPVDFRFHFSIHHERRVEVFGVGGVVDEALRLGERQAPCWRFGFERDLRSVV
jgi:hypothetical protein